MDNLQYFPYIILFLIAVREGMVLADWKQGNKRYSQLWHIVGMVIRGLLVAMIVILQPDIYVLIGLLLAWPVYNIMINIYTRRKWYYLSNKGIDGVIRKILFFIKFD